MRSSTERSPAFDMISRSELTPAQRECIVRLSIPVEIETVNGTISTTELVPLSLPELGNHTIHALVVEQSPVTISLGTLCVDDGFDFS